MQSVDYFQLISPFVASIILNKTIILVPLTLDMNLIWCCHLWYRVLAMILKTNLCYHQFHLHETKYNDKKNILIINIMY